MHNMGSKYAPNRRSITVPIQDQLPPLPPSENESRPERTLFLAVLPLLLLSKAADDHGLCLDLTMRWSRGWEICKVWMYCPHPAVLNSRQKRRWRSGVPAWGFGLACMVHCRWSKGQWRLSLEVFDTYCRAPASPRKCDLNADRRPELESDLQTNRERTEPAAESAIAQKHPAQPRPARLCGIHARLPPERLPEILRFWNGRATTWSTR